MRAGPLLAATAVLSSAAPALGAGFYITDIGTRGMGRAGAFVAAPDSLLAIHYNPAGLALLSGFHGEASVSMVDFVARFQRSCPCTPGTTDGAAACDAQLEADFAGNEAHTETPIAIPFLAFGYGLPWLDTTVAVAAYGPNSGRHNWGDLPATNSPLYESAARASPQRYRALDVDNLEANLALAVAFSPVRGLRIGASGYAYATGSDQGLTLWTNFDSFPEAPEDPRFDVPVQFQLQNTWGFNWGVGVSWEPIEGLSVGSSFRALRKIRGQGKLQAQLPRFLIDPSTGQPLLGAQVNGDDVIISLRVAPIWRGGVQYRLPGWFRAEGAVVWEGWSTHDKITIEPQGVSFDLQGDRFEIPVLYLDRQWRDTWAVRIGGELERFEPYLGLRAGYFYETSAVPEARVDAARIDRPKHGVALGVATTLYGITVELSGMYVRLANHESTDSQIVMTRIFTEPTGSDRYLTTVGNGAVRGQYFIGSLSLSFALDALGGTGARRKTAATFELGK
ncbi:MAG: outer membrane protein transport protein [Myxococcales bacterium]|nr:outer membrane protein transport protein [Myxococcales bacterium]